MNKKVFVTGDISTRDKFKLSGFINGFSKITEIQYLDPPLISKIRGDLEYDIIFGESGDWENLDYSNIGSVFMWTLIDTNMIIEISKKYPDTKFFICSKSIIHDFDVTSEYIDKYGTSEYMRFGIEGVDLIRFNEVIKQSLMLEKNLYQITNNLFYLYLPCSLASEDIGLNQSVKDIDITYFGTRENRPGVTRILDIMTSKGYNVVSNLPGKYISPEECISYYKRSIITIHEQVGPVYLEFPVRFGEASYCGSKIFSLDKMSSLCKYANDDPNIPSFVSFESDLDLIESAIEYINLYKKNNIINDDKNYTYEFYCKKILELAR